MMWFGVTRLDVICGGALCSCASCYSLQDPFTDVLKKLNVTDPFVTNWLNLLCFLLQGLPSSGTLTAVMAYMIADWCRPVSQGRGER